MKFYQFQKKCYLAHVCTFYGNSFTKTYHGLDAYLGRGCSYNFTF